MGEGNLDVRHNFQVRTASLTEVLHEKPSSSGGLQIFHEFFNTDLPHIRQVAFRQSFYRYLSTR